MFSVAAFVEQSAVHARMQSFDPPFQDFRERGEARNFSDWNFFLSQQIRRASGGNNIDSLPLERARQFSNAGLVGDGNESAGDLHIQRVSTADYADNNDMTVNAYRIFAQKTSV